MMVDVGPSKRIIVTGCAGFIGMNVVKRLRMRGHRVCGIDLVDPGSEGRDEDLRSERLRSLVEDRQGNDFEYSHVDVRDFPSVLAVVAHFQPEVVIHLAANAGVLGSSVNPLEYAVTNVVGFTNIVEAVRKTSSVSHVIYASSSSVYGESGLTPALETQRIDSPLSVYAATKACDELLAQSYSRVFGLPITGLRFFSVYGPWGRPDMSYFKMARALIGGRPVRLNGGGAQLRDFTFVDDVIDVIDSLLECPPRVGDPGVSVDAPHRILNVCSGVPIAISEMAETLAELVGNTAVYQVYPMPDEDPSVTNGSNRLLKEVIGEAPQTTLHSGMRSFIEWLWEFDGVRDGQGPL